MNVYAAEPASQAYIVNALQGSDGILRLRVGDWRVTTVDDVVLEILEVQPRGSAYNE